MRRLPTWFVLAAGVLLFSCSAAARSKAARIDAYCKQLQLSMGGTMPAVFAGPNPWTQLDQVPASMPDDGVAYVYSTGSQIRWVFIRILDPHSQWAEDVDYFFEEDGSLVKRVRHVQAASANIELEVSSYFADGRLVKQASHHYALQGKHQDASKFVDPDAPIFWTTDDLPFPAIEDVWQLSKVFSPTLLGF